MKRPPLRAAKSQLSKAVRALPIWMRPVGDGAKRTMGPLDMRLHRSVARALQHGWARIGRRSRACNDRNSMGGGLLPPRHLDSDAERFDRHFPMRQTRGADAP